MSTKQSGGWWALAFTSAGILLYLMLNTPILTPYAASDINLTTVESSGNVGQYSSIAIDSTGTAHISHLKLITNYFLHYCNNSGGVWSCFSLGDIASTCGQDTSIATDSNDIIHISYMDGPFPYSLGYCNNSGGTWTCALIDTDNSTGGYNSIAIDSNDIIHIAFQDMTNLTARYCSNTGGSWSCETIDDSSLSMGAHNSIAIDSNDIIHITHFDYDNNHLRYCNNSGGTWTCETVDSGTTMQSYSSLAVGPNNVLHVAYQSQTSNLRYCSKTGSTWSCTDVETTDSVGEYPSLSIDVADNIHLSHFDNTNNQVRYCNNKTGSWTCEVISTTGGATIVNGGRGIATKKGRLCDSPLFSDDVHLSFYNHTPQDLVYAKLKDYAFYSNITKCSTLNRDGATYRLTADIFNSSTQCCINITADNITFNGLNHTIDGDDATKYGICVHRTSSTTTNITIKNCIVSGWDDSNIRIVNASNNTIWNITSTNTTRGLTIIDGDYNILLDSSMGGILINESDYMHIYNSTTKGILMDHCKEYEIIDNNIINSSSHGISILTYPGIIRNNNITGSTLNGTLIPAGIDNCSITGNTIHLSGDVGLHIQGDLHNITGNTITNSTNDGVYFNSDNSTFDSNNISNNEDGGLFYGDYSNLSNNRFINNSDYGAVFYVDLSSITNNIARNNTGHGFRFYKMDHTSVTNCNSSYNGKYGIYVYNGEFNNFTNCHSNHNNWIGIYISSEEDGRFTDSSASYNTDGASISACIRYTLLNNDFSYNSRRGIRTLNSLNLTIQLNTLNYNTKAGLNMSNTNHSIIEDNTIGHNTLEGIWITHSFNNTFYDNRVNYNRDNIYLRHSDDNNLTENDAKYSDNDGIVLWYSHNNTVYKNILLNNTHYGIYIRTASDNIVDWNEVCFSGTSDFWETATAVNTGDDNMCDEADGWDDGGTSGCSGPCIPPTPTLNSPANNTVYSISSGGTQNVSLNYHTSYPFTFNYLVFLNGTLINTTTQTQVNISLGEGTDNWTVLSSNKYGNSSSPGIYYFTISSIEVDITVCTTLDSSGKTYYLTQDILDESTNCCINITADNITFNGLNHTIGGNRSTPYGICIIRDGSTYTNNLIKNCVVLNWSESNIYLENANNNTLQDLNSTKGLGYGLSITDSDYNTVVNSSISLNYFGGSFRSSDNNLIQSNTINNNTDKGLCISHSSNNTLYDNTVNYNVDNIYLNHSDDNNLTENDAKYSDNDGIVLWYSHNNTVYKNILLNNTHYGIYIRTASDNIVDWNEVCFSGTSDFWETATAVNTGDDNMCDEADGWDDGGTSGCSGPCIPPTPTLNSPANNTVYSISSGGTQNVSLNYHTSYPFTFNYLVFLNGTLINTTTQTQVNISLGEGTDNWTVLSSNKYGNSSSPGIYYFTILSGENTTYTLYLPSYTQRSNLIRIYASIHSASGFYSSTCSLGGDTSKFHNLSSLTKEVPAMAVGENHTLNWIVAAPYTLGYYTLNISCNNSINGSSTRLKTNRN